MDKDIIINGVSKETESSQNLKIRIPSPKVEDINIKEKSKEKKYNCFTYVISCIYCYED